MGLTHMSLIHNDELKKGSAAFLILSLVEVRARHGYEIAQLIDQRSEGAVTFHAASLYPLLYRLEKRGLIVGRWAERAGARRRRLYRATAAGRKVLATERSGWETFVRAIERITGGEHA
jgi:PadR family transcriptional regulator PadR